MEKSEKTKLLRMAKLMKDIDLLKSGYAGILSTGGIVDRRKFPDAKLMPKNPMMGIPKPKEKESTTIMVNNGKARITIYWYLDDKHSIYISGLKVNKSVRGRGIGRWLMKQGEVMARQIMAENIYLWVENETWMHEWYKRLGYSDLQSHEKEGYIWMSKVI